MRRADKYITDQTIINDIISHADSCRIAMTDGDRPYIVPVNFGIIDNTVFIHSAREGRKIDILRKNPRVCLEWDDSHVLVKADTACGWGMKYRSVIAEGSAQFVSGTEEKIQALNCIMKKYSGKDDFTFSESSLLSVEIIRIDLEAVSGKSAKQ